MWGFQKLGSFLKRDIGVLWGALGIIQTICGFERFKFKVPQNEACFWGSL